MPELLPTLREIDSQAALPLDDWLAANYTDVVNRPMAARHIRAWAWLEALESGKKPRALIEIWPRGSGKSTTIELGVVRVGVKLSRRFALYVCGAQEQADLHVSAIADHFEDIGVQRALNVYGSSKGWRRNQLRTANGFNVAGLGLDVAMRGIKMGPFRPDLIIFDDVDDISDSPKTVQKKLTSIQSKILAAGSIDCAVYFIQNLIHEDSIASQITDGRAQFLLDREASDVEIAVTGLETEIVDRGDGRKVWRIKAGAATWEGQSLETCERQISEWGLPTFLREAQQEVETADGFFFDHKAFEIVEALSDDLTGFRFGLFCDLAATVGGGDFTVIMLMGRAPNGVFWVVDVWRGQWGWNQVQVLLAEKAAYARDLVGCKLARLPQDPGAAGKAWGAQLKDFIEKAVVGVLAKVVAVTGAKAARARGWQSKVNSGNVRLVRGDWNRQYIEEHRKFREDEQHEFDDQIDPSADGLNEVESALKEMRAL